MAANTVVPQVDYSKPLDNLKHEKFAQARYKTPDRSAWKVYKELYGCVAATAKHAAYELEKTVDVKGRLAHWASLEEANVVSPRERISAKYLEILSIPINPKDVKPSHIIQAGSELAKLQGLYPETGLGNSTQLQPIVVFVPSQPDREPELLVEGSCRVIKE